MNRLLILKEIEVIYNDYQLPENLSFDVHEGAHEIDLPGLLSFFGKHLAHQLNHSTENKK